MGKQTMWVGESSWRNKLSHGFNTSLCVKKWRLKWTRLRGIDVCRNLCYSDWMSDFSGVLIPSEAGIKLNHGNTDSLFFCSFPVKHVQPEVVGHSFKTWQRGNLQTQLVRGDARVTFRIPWHEFTDAHREEREDRVLHKSMGTPSLQEVDESASAWLFTCQQVTTFWETGSCFCEATLFSILQFLVDM